MPRDYPATFTEQSTYGVTGNAERDRLPEIPAAENVSQQDILIGQDDVPISICLAGLLNTDDEDDIIRLVIGALLHGSKTPTTKAKVMSTAKGTYAKILSDWTSNILKDHPAYAETDGTVSDTVKLPALDWPKWVEDLELSAGALLPALIVDSVELAAYAGVLAFAIGKQPDADNIEAFNTKRRNAIRAALVSGNLRIFTDNSPYLSLEVLLKVHRAFNLNIKDRALVLGAIVDNDDPLVSGTARMFYNIFRLSAGASLNPLLIITRYARQYPHFYAQFRDLETEYHAAAAALARFYDVSEKRRLYLKVIFGNAYVPVNRDDIASLLGVAVFTLQQSQITLENYKGGVLSVAHREKLIRLLGVTARQEEEVPEE